MPVLLRIRFKIAGVIACCCVSGRSVDKHQLRDIAAWIKGIEILARSSHVVELALAAGGLKPLILLPSTQAILLCASTTAGGHSLIHLAAKLCIGI